MKDVKDWKAALENLRRKKRDIEKQIAIVIKEMDADRARAHLQRRKKHVQEESRIAEMCLRGEKMVDVARKVKLSPTVVADKVVRFCKRSNEAAFNEGRVFPEWARNNPRIFYPPNASWLIKRASDFLPK